MTGWTGDELTMIAGSEELELTSVRRDGTQREPVTIWVVRHSDDLYVRSWRGGAAAWFRAVQDVREGRIRAGGVERDVAFVPVDDLDDRIDDAYRTKYADDPYMTSMIGPEARATTIRLVPRS